MASIPVAGEGAATVELAERLRGWARRALVIPLYTITLLALLATAPLLFAATALADRADGAAWPRTRCITFLLIYLGCEVGGMLALLGLWLASWIDRDRERALRRSYALQCWWARTLYRGAERVFGMTTEVQGADALGSGPILLFSRHVSLGDTVIPALVLSDQRGWRLRYVLKRELLWDPCLDIMGNRLPNYFVRRGSGESQREIAALAALASGIGSGEGVLIYPEGTRFTPEKRARALARIAQGGDTELAALAARLHHVLPPHLGGPLALIEASPDADAVFCAHTGFEGAGRAQDLWRGSLVHRRIRMQLWRVPRAEIPRGREALAAWLYEQWLRVDDWVGRSLAADPDKPLVVPAPRA